MAVSETRPQSAVRIARKAKFPRLIDAAAAIGISVGYLSMIENGYVPQAKLREKIAEVFEATVATLWPGVA